MYLILIFCSFSARLVLGIYLLPYFTLTCRCPGKVERLSSYNVGLIVENNWDVIYELDRCTFCLS